jgi:hypothetical protein
MSVTVYQLTGHIPKGLNHQQHKCNNLKSPSICYGPTEHSAADEITVLLEQYTPKETQMV